MRKNFISMASVLPYTKEELSKLRELIEWDGLSFGDYCDLSVVLDQQLSYGGYHMDRPDNYDYKRINFLQYLLVYHRKWFLFLMCVPAKEVSLYITAMGPLGVLAQWRLMINK